MVTPNAAGVTNRMKRLGSADLLQPPRWHCAPWRQDAGFFDGLVFLRVGITACVHLRDRFMTAIGGVGYHRR